MNVQIVWPIRMFLFFIFFYFFKGDLSGNGTALCPFERCCRGQLWEASPWTDKSGELSLCLSCCSNLECIIKGEASGRVLESVFSQSCKSCEFIVAVTLGPASAGFHWCSADGLPGLWHLPEYRRTLPLPKMSHTAWLKGYVGDH